MQTNVHFSYSKLRAVKLLCHLIVGWPLTYVFLAVVPSFVLVILARGLRLVWRRRRRGSRWFIVTTSFTSAMVTSSCTQCFYPVDYLLHLLGGATLLFSFTFSSFSILRLKGRNGMPLLSQSTAKIWSRSWLEFLLLPQLEPLLRIQEVSKMFPLEHLLLPILESLLR